MGKGNNKENVDKISSYQTPHHAYQMLRKIYNTID